MKTKKQSLGKVLTNGTITENPTFRLVLGTCPTIATTVSVINGFTMGIATTFVLICSNIVISLLKNFIPEKIRIPAYIVVIASFVTIVEMVMKAYLLELYEALGVFIQLIVVNCIILARAESFAGKSENSVVASAVDGLGMGIGFTIALSIIGTFRELIGSGTIGGITIFPSTYAVSVFAQAAGGFVAFGLFLGPVNVLFGKIDGKRKKAKTAAAKAAAEAKKAAAAAGTKA